MNLTKNYRLVWSDTKEVLSLGAFESGSTTGCKNGFESNTKADVDAEIKSQGIIVPEDIAETWKKTA